MDTICMNCQNLFSGKNKKNILKCRLLKLLPRVLSVKIFQVEDLEVLVKEDQMRTLAFLAGMTMEAETNLETEVVRGQEVVKEYQIAVEEVGNEDPRDVEVGAGKEREKVGGIEQVSVHLLFPFEFLELMWKVGKLWFNRYLENYLS